MCGNSLTPVTAHSAQIGTVAPTLAETTGEHFRGLLVPLVMRGKMLAATRSGFAAFNADLKLRTEAPT